MTKKCNHKEKNKFCGLDCLGVKPIKWEYIGEWIREDGSICNLPYPKDVSWFPDEDIVMIEGRFSLDELIELGEYLKLKKSVC